MPELPEVETVARSLRPRIVGRMVRSVETSGFKLRARLDVDALTEATVGATIASVERVAKYLLVRLARPRSEGHTLLVHLGMSGRLVVDAALQQRAPHTHAVLALDPGLEGASEELRYVDPRRFGLIVPYRDADLARAPELADLGPDPLSDAFTVEKLRAELAKSGRDVKRFLLDQTRVVGLGNIYVAEALHLAGISPRRRADTVSRARAVLLHRSMIQVLESAIAHRGTTFRSYVDGSGERGGNLPHLAVYGREGEPCRTCGAPIRRLVQGARSTFYCPKCQR